MAEKPLKLFKRSDVTKNNDNKTTHIIIHNSVYDVSEFLNEVSVFLRITGEELGEFVLHSLRKQGLN